MKKVDSGDKMTQIVATPFLLSELEHSDARERNAMEIASAFIIIDERRNRKVEKLDFVSRFYIPFFVVPLDNERGLPLVEPSVFSRPQLIKDMSRIEESSIELTRSKKPNQMAVETHLEYGEKLIGHMRALVTNYSEKKRKYKIDGFLDEKTLKDFIPFISAVRLVKNVPTSKIIPVSKELPPNFLDSSSLKYYPSRGLVNTIDRQHRELISITENFLDQIENEIKQFEKEFREKKIEQEEKVKRGIQKAEQDRDRIIREQDESLKKGPEIPFPTPGEMLETYLKRIGQSFQEIRNAAQKKSVDLTFRVCKDGRGILRDASNYILQFEEEVAKYKRAIEELERSSLREKKRATEECEVEKRRLEDEMHRILESIRKNIEKLANLIKQIEETRSLVSNEHSKWLESMQDEISSTNDFVVPLEFFDHDPGVPFRLYLTVYLAQYTNRKRSRRALFEPMNLSGRGSKYSISPNSGLKSFVDTIEKKFLITNKEICSQLDEATLDDRINDLRREKVFSAFSLGMKLLLEKKIIDPKTYKRVNNAYDEYLRISAIEKK